MRHAILFTIAASVILVTSCSPSKGDRRGHEFMPDMVHAVGYDANLYDYYYFNRWGTEEEYLKYASPRSSVNGTIARGEISAAHANDPASRMQALVAFEGIEEGSMAITPNGRVPYYYKDTEEDRSRATREITQNPFPITEAGLEHGKELYIIYCGICHGEKADGQGYLVREENPAKGIVAGVYPAAPANFLSDTFVNASVGRFYHSIMYGKNVMGSYADKLSYKERWDVIHYIRSLQAVSKNASYSATSNTFNNESTPWAAFTSTMQKDPMEEHKETSTAKEVHDEKGQQTKQH